MCNYNYAYIKPHVKDYLYTIERRPSQYKELMRHRTQDSPVMAQGQWPTAA